MKKWINLLIFLFFCNTFLFAVVINTEKTAVVDMKKIFNEYPKTKEQKKDLEIKKVQLRKSLEFKQAQIDEMEKKYTKLFEVEKSTENTKVSEEMQKTTATIENLAKNVEIQKPEVPDAKKETFEISDSTSTKNTEDLPENYSVKISTEIKKEEVLNQGIDSFDVKKSTEIEKIEPEVLKKSIETSKKELLEYQKKVEKEIETLEKKYLHNTMGKIYDNINFIAKKLGYSVIFDKSDLAYSDKASDITDLIIREMTLNSK